MDTPELSIVVPVYNEKHRLNDGLRQIIAFMNASPLRCELVLSDDGSTDDTAAQIEARIAGRDDARLLRLPRNRGKGAAVKEGMLAARGEVRLFTDIDLSVPIAEAESFVAKIRAGSDVVIGTRKVEASDVQVYQPRHRRLLGEVFRQFTLRLFTPTLSDITCGFKAFTAAAAQRVFAPSVIERWSFDAEILFLALRYGLHVAEVPVTWRNNPETKVRLAVDLPRSLLELLRIRWNWLIGRYPKAL
ncbi:MAG TPA: glycosyltransferase [bacterium]|nr:glycosyltransferase [bacterium]